MTEGIEIQITFNYTPEHRFDSDLNEKCRDVVAKLVAETGSKDDGESGGTGFGLEEGAFASDQTFHLIVPDIEVGEKIRKAVDTMIKFYDERYEARLELPTTEEDLVRIYTDDLAEQKALLAVTTDVKEKVMILARIKRAEELLDGWANPRDPEPLTDDEVIEIFGPDVLEED